MEFQEAAKVYLALTKTQKCSKDLDELMKNFFSSMQGQLDAQTLSYLLVT